MTTALRFAAALGPQPGGAVALRFGSAPEQGPRLAALRSSWSTSWRRTAAATPMGASMPWTCADAAVRTAAALPWAAKTPVPPAACRLPWQQAAWLAPARVSTGWVGMATRSVLQQSAWRDGLRAGFSAQVPWPGSVQLQRLQAIAWRNATLVMVEVDSAWSVAQPAGIWLATALRDAVARDAWCLAPWQGARHVEGSGVPRPVVVPQPPKPGPAPCWLPEPGEAVQLLFGAALPAGPLRLLFACWRPSLVVVPIRRVYMVSNNVSLTRLSDGAAIPTLGLSLSLDVDSWAWGFQATLPADALALIEPPEPGEPCVLQASVNGTPVRIAVESISRERTFGKASVRIAGRGLSAALADPYQPVTTFSAAGVLTSQQLLDQALPVGWDADWGLTAWSVPGGVWSHQGTPITAAVAIAAAGGGYVQPHDTLQRLRVLPLYPAAPWDWAAVSPDLELPSAAVQRETIEWVEKARYNRVYVSGVAAGVLARVTRAGTAGDLVAPMVTDALTTHIDAGRQRGLAILANTGRQALVTLRLPVLPETGLIRPGKLIRYTDGGTIVTGLSRSLSVESSGSSVWQSVRIETHVE